MSIFQTRNSKANNALEALKPDLRELDGQLDRVGLIGDPLDRLVALFQAVAPWHDRQDEIRAALDTINGASKFVRQAQAMETLKLHFGNAGRDKYGINRTQPTQKVTPADVFLGGIHGIWTFTVADWKEKLARPNTSKETIGIIKQQAADFAESHIKPMRDQLRLLIQ